MNNYIWEVQLDQLNDQPPVLIFQRNRSYREYKINSDNRAVRVEEIFNKYSGKVSIYSNGIGVYFHP